MLHGFKGVLFLLAICLMTVCPQAEAGDRAQSLPLVKETETLETTDALGNQIEMSYTSLRLTSYDKAFEKLFGALSAYSSGEALRVHYGWEDYQKRVTVQYNERLEGGASIDGIWFARRNIFVRRSDTSAVSFLERDEAHYGGPMPGGDVHSVFGRTLDSRTGRYLYLLELCPDRERLAEALIARLRADYPDAPFQDWKYLSVLYLLDSGEKDLRERSGGVMAPEVHLAKATWTLESDGMTFWFNPGALGALHEGIYFVTIPFAEAPELFHSKYFRDAAHIEAELTPEVTPEEEEALPHF